MYHPNYKGEEVYFIRQVDDFAISCKSKHLADEIIALIDQHMTITVKPLGVITRFNGVDVHQTQHYIKVNNATYLKKILADKKCTDAPTHNLPLSMSKDSNYNMEIKSAAPLEDRELCQTEKKFGFTYRQGVGELIYAMVTCRRHIIPPHQAQPIQRTAGQASLRGNTWHIQLPPPHHRRRLVLLEVDTTVRPQEG